MTDVRRLTLEVAVSGGDYSVVVVWLDDQTLHAALMDYGDSDYMGRGMDIREPTQLLESLVYDRFSGQWDRFVEYCSSNGIGISEDPQGPPLEASRHGIPLTWAGDALLSHHGPWGQTPTCYRIQDWRGLTLVLLRDRCEGRNSWSRLTALLDDAKIESVERWRGYV